MNAYGDNFEANSPEDRHLAGLASDGRSDIRIKKKTSSVLQSEISGKSPNVNHRNKADPFDAA